MLGEINDFLFGHTSHDWVFDGFVYHSSKVIPNSAAPATARRYKCRCGKTYTELTDAGRQQMFAGDNFDDLIGNVNA